MFSNMNLKDYVLEELDFEPGVDAAHVGVTVDNGVVCLTGHVPSLHEKTLAEEAVWRVAGVKGLAADIVVRLPNTRTFDDESIAGRAIDYLEGNAQIPDDAVHVTVQDGWVTLTGELEWQYQKRLVSNILLGLRGVRGITNEVRLAPRVQFKNVKKRIEKALHRRVDVDVKGIDVQVNNGCVVLKGQVTNRIERSQIMQIAWSVPGVYDVIDRMICK